jgi:hypothetical protein
MNLDHPLLQEDSRPETTEPKKNNGTRSGGKTLLRRAKKGRNRAIQGKEAKKNGKENKRGCMRHPYRSLTKFFFNPPHAPRLSNLLDEKKESPANATARKRHHSSPSASSRSAFHESASHIILPLNIKGTLSFG